MPARGGRRYAHPHDLLTRIPEQRLRVLSLASGLVLIPGAVQAVIPGLAPALLAILPQVLFLVCLSGLLIFSPRAWWRLLRSIGRHPLQAAGVTAAGALLVLAAWRLGAAFPAPPGVDPLPEHVRGYPIGDLQAARAARGDSGPRSAPRPRAVEIPGLSLDSSLLPFGNRVLLFREGGSQVSCFDPVAGRTAWEFAAGKPLLAPPLGCRRRLPEGGALEVAICILGGGEAAAAPPGIEIVLVNGESGTTLSRLALAGKQPRVALIDDHLVVAFADSVVGVSLADSARPLQAWRVPRPPGPLQGLAGDDEGRFFLLLESGLHAGDLEVGRLEALADFRPERSLAFALHWGRIYVLLAGEDGSRRLVGLDPVPAASRAWSRALTSDTYPELAAASFGVVLTGPGALEVLDLATGRETARVALDGAPAACPAAVSPHSAYVLLANGDVLRYAPARRRIEWRIEGASGAPALESRPGASALAICGERLLVVRRGLAVVLAEVESEGGAGWGQWRGGASRQGTCDPDRVPIAAAKLWTLALPRVGDGEAAGPGRHPLEVIPLEEGWLALDAGEHRSRLHWVDDGGRLLHTLEVEGGAWCPIREGSQLHVALRRPDRDLVASFLPRRLDGAASLQPLWKAPARRLAGRHPLAASAGSLILCEESALRALSSEDGSPRWNSMEVQGAGAPAIAGGRIFAAGRDARGNEVLAALEAASGALLWKAERPGSGWEAPSVVAGRVIAIRRAAPGEARIVELEAGDGTVRRETAALAEAPILPLVLTGESLVAGGRAATSILSRAGELVGRIEGGGSTPPVAGYGLLLVAGGRGVRCVDTSTLETVWEAALPGAPESLAGARGLIAGASGGELFCLGAP